MRYISDLSVPKTVTESVDGFVGYSRSERNDGKTLCRAENISDTRFPSVCPRHRRASLGSYGKITSILADEQLARVEDGRFFNGDTRVSDEYFSENFNKQILRLGDYFVVMPMGIYYNVYDNTDFGTISRGFSMGASGIELITVDKNFNEISEYTVLRTRPTAAEEGELWAQPKTDGGYEMKRYDGYEWRPYESYVKLKSESLAQTFRVGDILDCKGVENVIGDHIKICYKDGTGIYFEGAAPQKEKIEYFSLRRSMPIFQQVTVSGGRMIGVYCGYDEDGKFISKAYASALNNPLCWSVYGGAITVDVGGCAPFTAIKDFCGDTLAFRENSIVRLKISNEKISFSVTECEGIKMDGESSAVCIGGTLYYKSPSAVCAYDGSFPKKISSPLGEAVSTYNGSAPAGAYNGKYYIRLADKNGKSNIYVYNTATKSWSVEDDPGVKKFLQKGGELIALCDEGEGSSLVLWDYDNASESCISYFAKDGYPVVENTVKWFFETGETAVDIKKGLSPSRLFLKVRLKAGASLSAGCVYNGRSAPDRIVSISDKVDGYFEIPCLVTKCDSVRLLVFGRGDAEVLGYAIEYGADEA